jgi:Lecithin:cholesterol acyltransferase
LNLSKNITQDAVVVVPGIMGSVLREVKTRTLLWGLSAGWYLKAWCAPGELRRLQLTDEEREGQYDRVTATGLLTMPAYAPGLSGFEPYTDLIDGIKGVVADRAAIREFAYDWRLPVEHNARLLAEAAYAHVKAWREHPAHLEAVRSQPDQREARLVFVAHSMGGLLVQALGLVAGGEQVRAETRASITIGTPFRGAAKAAVLLNSGAGAPLPKRRLRKLAATMPGVHDLLPTYRCVDLGDDVARLSPSDIAALGGDRQLAEDSARLHARLADLSLIGHRQYLGLGQPTISSLTLDKGVATGQLYTFEVNADGSLVRYQGQLKRVLRHGDGTVPRNSAELVEGDSNPPQQHGSLARMPEVVRNVRRILTEKPHLGAQLGEGELGLEVPDLIDSGTTWAIHVTGAHNPTCRIFSAHSGEQLARIPLGRRDGTLTGDGPHLAPGLYRVEIQAGSNSPVSQLVLMIDPEFSEAE